MSLYRPICPRCGGYVPNNDSPGAYPGAMSRTPSRAEVCSACGVEEAFESMSGTLVPQEAWPLPSDRAVNVTQPGS